MKDKFSEIARRTRRWTFEDGTTELMLGGIFFWAAMYFLLQLIPALSPALIFFILAGFIAMIFVPNWLKRRYVYLRSGYVNYPETSPRGFWKSLLWGALGSVLVTVLIYLALIYNPDHAFAWITMLVAVLIGLVWLISNLYYKIPRLAYLGIFSMALGIILSPLVLGSEFTRSEHIGGILFACYFLVMAVSLFVSGGLAFRAFLRNNPLPKESPDEQ